MRIKRTLGTLALASTLVLAGCSDDDGDGGAETGAAASDTTTPTGDETEAQETDATEGDEIDIEEFLAEFEEGVEATTTARMSMVMETQGEEIDIEGDVDYTTDPVSMAMVMSGGPLGGDDLEMRIVDGSVYMNLGDASQGKFLELSLEQLSAQAGVGNFTEQLDPGAQLETFRQGLTEVEFVGDDEVDGVDAEHYALVVDTTRLDESAAGMPADLELDIWLDDENRVIQTTSDLGAMGNITANVFDFGADVDIEKPAPSQIQQIPSA